MKIKFLKESAGIKVGTELDAPDVLANDLIGKGIAEELKAVVKKEETTELKTKENKQTSKRKTKSRK